MFPQSPRHLHTSVHSIESNRALIRVCAIWFTARASNKFEHWFSGWLIFHPRSRELIIVPLLLMWFWFIFYTKLSITCFVYICFIWHSIEMTKHIFNFWNTSSLILIVSPSWDTLCKYSSSFWTVLNHFSFPFPLVALTELQPEIAHRAGRLSNTQSDHFPYQEFSRLNQH